MDHESRLPDSPDPEGSSNSERERLISELASQWLECFEDGKPCDLHALCQDHPDLLDDVRIRVEKLQAVSRCLEPNPDLSNIGEYQVIAPLGGGGSSTVYRCRKSILDREVAIKLFRPSGRQQLARFLQEANLMVKLDHPGFARILDCGQLESSRPYLVMEYVNGVPLDEYARGHSQGQKIELIRSLLEILQHLHEQGIAHCDIKPTNVLVMNDSKIKVLDLGVAKLYGDHAVARITKTDDITQILGTVLYMAPEQTRSRNVDARTDVYAVGSLAYKLLSDHFPIPMEGGTTAQHLAAIQTQIPQPLSSVATCVSPSLEAVIHKALEKDPAQRYQSAADFAADLHRLSVGEPVHAPLHTRWRRTVQWIAKHQAAVTGLALLAIVLIALGMQAWIASRRAGMHARKAERLTLENEVYQDVTARGHYNRTLAEALTNFPDHPQAARGLLLDESRCPPSQRDLTWNLLHSFVSECLHQGVLPELANGLCYDGKANQLYVGCKNGTVACLRDDLSPLTKLQSPSQDRVVIVSHKSDKQVLVAGTAKGDVLLWNLAPKEPGRIIDQLGSRIVLVSLTEAETAVVVARGGLIREYSTTTGKLIHSAEFGREIQLCDINAPFRILTIAHDDGLEFFHLDTQKRHEPIDRPVVAAKGLCAFPNEYRLVESTAGAELLFWDVRTGKLLSRFKTQFVAERLQVTQDRTQVFYQGPEYPIHRYRLGAKTDVYQPIRAGLQARAITVSGDGSKVFLARPDGVLGRWNQDFKQPTQAISDQRFQIVSCHLPLDDFHFIVGDMQGGVYRQHQDLTKPATRILHVGGPVRHLCLSDDRRFLAVGTDKDITVWDIVGERPLRHFAAGDFASIKFTGQQFLPKGGGLAMATYEGQLSIADVDSGHTLRKVATKSRVYHLATSQMHSIIAVFSSDFTELFDMQLKPLATLPTATHIKTSAVHGDTLVAANQQGKILRIDLKNYSVQPLTYPISGFGETAKLSSDGRTLLVGTTDGDLLFVDTQNGSLRIQLPDVAGAPITAIHADDTAIYVADRFKEFLRWDLRRANHNSRFRLQENSAE